MSPPLVVAFALAGRVDIDLSHGAARARARTARTSSCKDIWPTLQEIRDLMQAALKPEVFRQLYRDFAAQNPKWNEISSARGNVYQWDADQHLHPGAAVLPGLLDCSPAPSGEIKGARALGIFGDSVTTDHISPAGSHQEDVAGRAIPDRSTAWRSRISTATARAAATTG